MYKLVNKCLFGRKHCAVIQIIHCEYKEQDLMCLPAALFLCCSTFLLILDSSTEQTETYN